MSDEKNATDEAVKDVSTKNKKADAAPQDVTSQDFFDEKAKTAQETGVDQEIDLVSVVKVEVLKDFGYLTKGMKLEISKSAFDTYNMSGDKIVKEIR